MAGNAKAAWVADAVAVNEDDVGLGGQLFVGTNEAGAFPKAEVTGHIGNGAGRAEGSAGMQGKGRPVQLHNGRMDGAGAVSPFHAGIDPGQRADRAEGIFPNDAPGHLALDFSGSAEGRGIKPVVRNGDSSMGQGHALFLKPA